MKLQGIFPAIATPFDVKGDLYKIKVQHNIERWNRTQLAGYVVCGSTGEAALLSSAERVQLMEWVAQYAAPEKTLIAGTSAESVKETVEMANRAADMGYKAALVLPPHYYRATFAKPDVQKLFFRAVADQTKIPVLLYHFPQVTQVDLAPETVAELSSHPNIIGMKDSSGDLEGTKKYLAAVPKDFTVLTGAGGKLAPSLAAGCSGAVLAIANSLPYVCITIWEATRQREAEAAEDWQQRLKPATDMFAAHGIPGLKHAMDLMGYFGGPPRLPLVPVSPAAQMEIAKAYEGLKG
jgi:4-hydroxy-2-oxoglutarate aldolase